MHQTSSLTGPLSTKGSFLDKYHSISKIIKTNSSCYAVSSEWWAIFDSIISANQNDSKAPMENPGPINNLPLLNLSEIYQELVGIDHDTIYPETVDGQVLSEMSDWDNMSLKPNLKYRTDFVIISGFLWKFLQEHFQGGPEIELIPETKPAGPLSKMITSEDECALDKNLVVNTNLIKIQVTKDEDFESATSKYVSPSLTVQSLLNCLCKDYYLPPHKAMIYHKTNQNKLAELKDKKSTLAGMGVGNGSLLTISRGMESLLGFPSVNRNQEGSMWDREDETEDSKDNEEERRRRVQLTQDSDFEGNFSTNSRDSTDSARLSTGSTNPHLNPIDFSVFGDDIPEPNGQNRVDFIEMKDFEFGCTDSPNKQGIPDPNYPNVESFLKRSKQSTEKPKIKLGYKSLQEIKTNLVHIQNEWNLWTKSNLNKKV